MSYFRVFTNYLSLVKFSHTVFAMPFAFAGFFLGLSITEEINLLKLLALVVLCMIFARNTAMAFNRYIDRDIDKLNPRTGHRELPAHKIKPKAALVFVIVNAFLFIITTYFINTLAFVLSPAALFIVLVYSYTKRFTYLSHFVLGLALFLAPIGAYIAVTATINSHILFISLAVLFWVSGFDILYALQDMQFDKAHKLKSIPAVFGFQKSKYIALGTHIIAVFFLILAGLLIKTGHFFWIATLLFTACLIYQHILVFKYGLKKINTVFFTLNGLAGICFAVFFIIDIFI